MIVLSLRYRCGNLLQQNMETVRKHRNVYLATLTSRIVKTHVSHTHSYNTRIWLIIYNSQTWLVTIGWISRFFIGDVKKQMWVLIFENIEEGAKSCWALGGDNVKKPAWNQPMWTLQGCWVRPTFLGLTQSVYIALQQRNYTFVIYSVSYYVTVRLIRLKWIPKIKINILT